MLPTRLLSVSLHFALLLAGGAALSSCEATPNEPAASRRAEVRSAQLGTLPSPTAALHLASIEARFAATLRRPGSIPLVAHADGSLRPADNGSARAAHIVVAPTTDLPTLVRDHASGLTARVRLLGALPVSRRLVAGLAVAVGAGPAGATLIERASATGVEDYLYLERAPAERRLRYELSPGDAAGLRLVANTLELSDTTGAPRLRAAPPYLVDARGQRVSMQLLLSGCRYDADPRGPWGRTPTAAGAARCTVSLLWPSRQLSYPVLVDPAWESTFNNLAAARSGQTATELAPGSPESLVLVAGGFGNNGQALSSAELYHPLSRTFGATGSMATARGSHTATALASVPPLGGPVDILIAGGSSTSGGGGQSSMERYHPLTGSFTNVSVAPTPAPRTRHTATLYADAEVLLAGGFGAVAGQPVATAAVYTFDGLNDNLVPTPGPMQAPRARHTATRLTTADSDVLLTGGQTDSQGNVSQDGELFDPLTGTFNPITASNANAKLGSPRMDHTATLLADGRVLVTGGTNGTLYLNTVDLYLDAEHFGNATGFAFQPSPILMQNGRAQHSATLLPTGEVVVAGGRQGPLDADVIGLDERYDPVGNSFESTGVLIAVAARSAHVALLVGAGGSPLSGRAVWVAGGRSLAGATASAELLVRPLGDSCAMDASCGSGHCNPEGVCCDSGCTEDCYSCLQASKQNGTPDGLCGPTKAGLPPFVQSTCVNEVEVHRACDGTGQALPVLAVDCKPSTCNGSGTACSTGCDTDQDCSLSGWCDTGAGGGGGGSGGGGGGGAGGGGASNWAGSCQPKVDIGSPCDHDSQCKSLHCVDAVCCDLPCGGQCQACDNDNSVGKCSVVGSQSAPEPPHPNSNGAAPRAPCQGAGTDCGGACDGSDANGCVYPGAESEQSAPSCTCPDTDCSVGPATETHQVCDGAGAASEDPRGCAGYRCEDAERCKTGCSTDGDCILDYVCESGECAALTGPSCDGDHTVRLPAADDRDCSPYRCADEACLTACVSVDDCVTPSVCAAGGKCVDQLTAPELPGCSCRLPAAPGPGRKASEIIVLLALLLAGRRRPSRRG